MSNAMKAASAVLAACCLFLTQPSTGADAGPGRLVSVEWLMQNLGTADVLILDASPARVHAAQHIPGAVNVDMFSYGVTDTPVSQWEQRLRDWGIGARKKVLLYDQGGGIMATSLFFDLYYHGVPAENLFVLDGGLAKWRAAGGAVTSEPTPAPPQGSFRITRVNEDVRARLPEFLTASGDPRGNALLEALDASWHFGETAFFDRAGHVPNGIMLPADDFYNPDKTFKSADEIRRMLAYLGVKPGQRIYTYCGGGVAASVPFFALKFLLNVPDVKLFKESELGWLRDDRGLPFWTYDAPFLMRDTQWLKTWGGRMMRMYGVAQVSIVDVRVPEAFNQGHVPFALNVPAEVFKAHLANPEKLAALLGHAGVNASHEAVVTAEGGLNERSALAFLALEALGQKRVSVFMDSLVRWAELGFPVTRDATAVGPSQAPGDLSLPRTTYSAEPRRNTIIAASENTQGLYPKVYLASGRKIPGKLPEGKVVHVPYTELVNADGTPKAAKDIWKILANAGLPRYAEVICVSEEPGEAAANYYLLRLLGFPEVRVLVI